MSSKTWQYLDLRRDGRVLEVSFQSEHRVNSLNYALMRELTDLARELQVDSELSAVILTGRPETFSAGMDLRDTEMARFSELTVAEQRQ
ncbi:MAG: enoyl-CoA hydratase/isomerase family protein, partial [Halioglobus sp.]|nr:enoyl-CoA hydratase/isomerase family protein [Halioglobus sp.]